MSAPGSGALPERAEVVVVGAGLAGLAAARTVHRGGRGVLVLEASDGIGGRVRTDLVDGFLLDRGFQVVLTAYPELHRQLDVPRLQLRAFEPGALVWHAGRGHVVSDPFRRPRTLVSTAVAPVGSPLDKLRIARLRRSLRSVHPARLLTRTDMSTAEMLRQEGFGPTMVDRFFRPLVGGIQLDPELATSRRMFDVIFRCLADGEAAVPASGMGAIPAQLAEGLPPGSVVLHAPVAALEGSTVRLADGRQVVAEAVVVAAEGPVASELLGLPPVGSKSAGCVYFAASESPTRHRLVVLDGDASGPVANLAVMSNVAPSYAPAGEHLVAAALPGVVEGNLEEAARRQLRGWFGPVVDTWRHLRTYRITHGQPEQRPPFRPKQPVSLGEGRFVCGDHRDTASIQGALYSGRRCGEAVLAALT
jgi:phytoene dehydrogenase-like protein